MLGLLRVETSFAARKLHLGYREVRAPHEFAFGESGAKFRAHEFHYASILAEQGESLFETAGLRRGSVTGSFMHLIDLVE